MKMKNRIRIVIEFLAAFVLISLLLVAITGVVVVKFYGDDLEAFVLEQVNHRLGSKVEMEDVSVKVFRKFPNTSIVLREMTVWSSQNFQPGKFPSPGADTLLSAESVSVSFNLLSLIRGRYMIRQVDIRNGILHLYTDERGESNYQIFGESERTSRQDPFVNLNQLQIQGFRILLHNQAKGITSTGHLDKLELNGRFSREQTQIRGLMEGTLDEITNKGVRYASNREVLSRIHLTVNDSLYTIRSGQLQIDRISADMDGRFTILPEEGVELDLYASARDLEIHEVLDLFPSEVSSPLKGIHGGGHLQLYTRITGRASSTINPKVEADFRTSNANLSWDRFPFSLRSLNLAGTYSNGGAFSPVTTSIRIQELSALIGKDQLSGRGSINNFYDPVFSFELEGNIHPEQWIRWYDSIPLRKASGRMISDLQISGSYNRSQPRGERFLALDIGGRLELEEVGFLISGTPVPFSGINGSLVIDNDFWEPSFTGMYGNNDFSVSGSGLHLLSFLLKQDRELIASVRFNSGNLDLQEVLDALPGHGKRVRREIRFPENLDLRLEFIIDELHKEHFHAENVRGIALYNSPAFRVDSMVMQTMEGTLRGGFAISQDGAGMITASVSAGMYNLNIRELFHGFDNFGQQQVTHQHLRGTVSGSSLFSADFKPDFSILTPSIISENELVIRNGELYDFTPLMALSRFIAVEELQQVQFETLENTILIRENRVIIPMMQIESNALNLTASGTHGFDNHYDYRIRLKLSELLYNQAKRSGKREFETAMDDSDTRTLFLKIVDSGTGSTVEIDRERTAEKIRSDLKEEKAELKQVLNQEWGLFRKDTLPDDRNGEPGEEPAFRFEFQEDDPVPPDNSGDDSPKKKRRWWQKRSKTDTLENKPAQEFVFDETAP